MPSYEADVPFGGSHIGIGGAGGIARSQRSGYADL